MPIQKGKERRGLSIKELRERTNKGGQIDNFDQVYQTLIASLQRGFDNHDACFEAGITMDTFCRWKRESDDFRYEMDKASTFLVRMAERKSAEFIEQGDKQHIQWLLERMKKAKYSTRVEQTGADGGAIDVNIGNYDKVDTSNKSDEELQQLIAEQVRREAESRGRS